MDHEDNFSKKYRTLDYIKWNLQNYKIKRTIYNISKYDNNLFIY